MTLDEFKKNIAELISGEIECDYSDAESIVMAQEIRVDLYFAAGNTPESVAKVLSE